MDYSDIMDLDKPISHHKPMDITHRAKIFAPFAALKGFEDCIRQKEIIYEEYPALSEEQKSRLDQKMQMIHTGEALQMYEEILTAAQVSKKEGKGYHYPVMGHLVGISMSTRGDRKKLNAMAGY